MCARACVCVEQLWCLTSFSVCVRAHLPERDCHVETVGGGLPSLLQRWLALLLAWRPNANMKNSQKCAHFRSLWHFSGARSLALSAPPPPSHSVAGSAHCGRAWRGTSGESQGCCGLKDRGGFAVAGCKSVGRRCKVTNPQLVDCKTQQGQGYCPAGSQGNKSKTREQKWWCDAWPLSKMCLQFWNVCRNKVVCFPTGESLILNMFFYVSINLKATSANISEYDSSMMSSLKTQIRICGYE